MKKPRPPPNSKPLYGENLCEGPTEYDDFPPSLTVHDFGSHTYSFYANNERACVKFHFRTQQVIQNLTPCRAQQFLAAFTPRSVVRIRHF